MMKRFKLFILDIIVFIFKLSGIIDGFIDGILAIWKGMKFSIQMGKLGIYDRETIMKRYWEEYGQEVSTWEEFRKHDEYLETLKQLLSEEDWF